MALRARADAYAGENRSGGELGGVQRWWPSGLADLTPWLNSFSLCSWAASCYSHGRCLTTKIWFGRERGGWICGLVGGLVGCLSRTLKWARRGRRHQSNAQRSIHDRARIAAQTW